MPTNLLTRALRPIAASAGIITIAAALTLAGAGTASAATGPTCVGGTCTITFSKTGAPETWTVPAGVTTVTATVDGAAGGDAALGGYFDGSSTQRAAGTGGDGGVVTTTLSVTPGATLTAVAGGKGADGVADSTAPAVGGYPAGGNAGTMTYPTHGSGGAGGGGSFLFDASDLLVAAGGGGGGSMIVLSGQERGGDGGAGGTTSAGQAGEDAAGTPITGTGGRGGTSSGPGAGGTYANVGSPGGSTATSSPTAISAGGAGAINPQGGDYTTAGGGGSGFFGGGGGSTDGPGGVSGAGGGGSGFVTPSATGTTSLAGNSGDGSITIRYAAPAKTTTTTTLTVGNSPTAGTSVALTATVAPAPADGPLVTFKDGATTLGTAPVTNGKATFQANLTAGSHSVTAAFAGDSTHEASTSVATPVTVAPATAPLSAPAFADSSAADSPLSRTVSAGESFSFTNLGATGNPTPTYTVADEDGDGEILPDGVTFTNGTLAGSTEQAGFWQIAVTATNSQGTATEHVLLTVNAGPAVGLDTLVVPGDGASDVTHVWDVAPDGTVTEATETRTVENAVITAKQGEKISFIASPVDQYGNYADTTSSSAPEPVTKSNVASDTFSFDKTTGFTTVVFQHASPHTISYTLEGLSQSFTVQVAAAPVAPATTITPTALAYTGSNPGSLAGIAGLLLAAGGALRAGQIVRRRKHATR